MELELKPGQTYRIYYYPGNVNNRRIHIRAIVDDDYIVFRFWNRRLGWRYEVEDRYFFKFRHEQGHLIKIRENPKPDDKLSCIEYQERHGQPCGGYKVGCSYCPSA